ncbi:hypothetical protein AB6A40_006594, partial [Gnathostoma spinigerum]
MDEAAKSAEKAVQYDQSRKWSAAIYFYEDAANIILSLIQDNTLPISYKEKADGYVKRAEFLKTRSNSITSPNVKSKQQLDLERAKFLLYQAFDSDEAGNVEEAVTLYSEAVEFCIKSIKSCDSCFRDKLQNLAKRALDRAEELKELKKISVSSELHLPEVPTDELSQLKLDDNKESRSSHRPTSPSLSRRVARGELLDRTELQVLATTSNINGRQYVPFLTIDLKEKFAYPVPFSDPHGHLKLSSKQLKHLKGWMRPSEFMEDPKVIEKVDSGTIKQTVISDCSFISSLAISARYESRFGKRIVTSTIYPQNRRGEPVHNPCGKYMIKLHINGVWRKVVIDDYFPIGQDGSFLCSYSQKKNELWVSLLEKGYMKVMGGYDFPGSNSSIDMHALTGWIPERMSLKSPKGSDIDSIFEKLVSRFHQGHCLVTLATGNLSKEDTSRSGLVECHAYAVLDMRNVQGKRLLMLKNPWTHLRWKGRYSEKDASNWTPSLRKELSYSPDDAQQFDDGVFWIDYESVCRFFEVFYVNWDPSLFPYTYGLHAMWSAGQGPVKDLYSVAANPQYTLEVQNKNGTCAVWILLTRHITEKNDFADNKEYITVMVYKSGKKIYLPFDPKPILEPIRINSPHYLAQFVVTDPGSQKYTLVVAQHEKQKTIYYT